MFPISIISFVVKSKAYFFIPPEQKKLEPQFIINITDKELSLDLEDYIVGVVAGEMPASFAEEALKAQAIAARSFALSNLKDGEVSIKSTTAAQVFLTKTEIQTKWGEDYQKYYDKIVSCVKATEGLVVKRNNKILKTYYFAMSNGFTEDSASVFNETTFSSRESRWDNKSLSNFEVEKILNASDILKAFNLKDKILKITNVTRNKTDRVATLMVNGMEITGVKFRSELKLRSTDFNIVENNGVFTITTKGYGHGVGMSQYGANGMAKEGAKYDEILKYYYNDVEIQKI